MARARTNRLLSAATVAAAIAVVAACSGSAGDGGWDREALSTPVEDDPDFRIGDHADPYRVTYLLEDLGDSDVADSTEVLVVRAPFDSVLEGRSGPPPGRDATTRQIVDFSRFRVGAADAGLTVYRVPGPTPSDLRLAAVLDEAMEAGLVTRREQREVAGRRCQVVRSGTLLGAGPLRAPTEEEYADSCVDAAGILLEEILYLNGQPSLRRVATEVDDAVEVDPVEMEPGDVVVPVDQGGGSVLEVDPTAGSIGSFWTLPDGAVPTGFTYRGRWAVIPAQPEEFSDPARADSIVAGTVDVWVRGPDVVVVYQGGTRGQGRAHAPVTGAETVEAGDLGPAELVLSATGSEVRAALGSGRFVHVIGTIDPADLVGVASALTVSEGTGLVYLED